MKFLNTKSFAKKTLLKHLKTSLVATATFAALQSPVAFATSGLDLQSVITGSLFNCNVVTTVDTITPYANSSGNIAAKGYVDSVGFTFVGDLTLNFDKCDYTLTLDSQSGSSVITSATIADPVVTALTHSSTIDLTFNQTNIDDLAVLAVLNSSFVWKLVGTRK